MLGFSNQAFETLSFPSHDGQFRTRAFLGIHEWSPAHAGPTAHAYRFHVVQLGNLFFLDVHLHHLKFASPNARYIKSQTFGRVCQHIILAHQYQYYFQLDCLCIGLDQIAQQLLFFRSIDQQGDKRAYLYKTHLRSFLELQELMEVVLGNLANNIGHTIDNKIAYCVPQQMWG